MHAILTNPKLRDVIAWAPNGRSWRILKPRDFEVHVLPKYFEHSKFSSFVRQANGWGFRRLSQGRDRNAYYHEYFLRWVFICRIEILLIVMFVIQNCIFYFSRYVL